MAPAATNDLRSEAKAYQRDKNHNTKWALGDRPKCTRGQGCNPQTCPHTRPVQSVKKATTKALRRMNYRTRPKLASVQVDDGDERFDHATDNSNSSDDDVKDANAAPIPTDAEYMYSYDAPTGPSAGQTVLSTALNQAVQRFENIETEKLVTREYDVIDEQKEGYTADEEDDFEFIEHSHVN
jgi:hypothetical protein